MIDLQIQIHLLCLKLQTDSYGSSLEVGGKRSQSDRVPKRQLSMLLSILLELLEEIIL